ncbi:MAG: histidine phosphatase family protein [Cytophagales bacterium]|nr:histidine phosphatase family protein [Cytophagales bacterium]
MISCVLFVIWAIGAFAQKREENCTVVFLVRHAEQDKEIREDPPLNDQGKARAILLASLLSKTPINHVYSTEFKRAKETTQPIVEKYKAEWIKYDLKDDEKQLFSNILQNYRGKNVLLIGHSGNIVELLNAATQSSRFDESAIDGFSDLYILTFVGDNPAIVHRLRYGL